MATSNPVARREAGRAAFGAAEVAAIGTAGSVQAVGVPNDSASRFETY